MNKKQGREARYFIRATTTDKVNGVEHKILTTHGTYSHAAIHLTNVIGAERGNRPHAGWNKGNVQFHILPMTGEKMKKDVRTENLNEFVERVEQTHRRTRQQIIEDAEKRAIEKKENPEKKPPFGGPGNGLKPPSAVAKKTPEKAPASGTKSRTISGEKPNEIEMNPVKRSDQGKDNMHPVVQPSPSSQSSS